MGQVPCALTVSLKSSPSERKWVVVPSIDFRNTNRSALCCAVSCVWIVVFGGKPEPPGPSPCSGNTSSRVWAWPRWKYGAW